MVVTITALSTLFTVGGYVPIGVLGLPAWPVQAVLWVPWVLWLGWFFPWHHGRPDEGTLRRFRSAFFLHIAPGISWNFAQMTRPGLVGLADPGGTRLATVIVGLVLAATGAIMIAKALVLIGVDRALFLGEYDASVRTLVVSGIYRRMRHPLFTGGVVTSVGMAVFFWNGDALAMAAVNVAVLPIYVVLEDRRCRIAHTGYDEYRRAVRGIVPARALHLSRSDGPTSGSHSADR